MEMTQIKGVAVTVGATAAFTALLTGSIVAVNEHYDAISNIDTAEAFNDLQIRATNALTTGLTGAFSDHRLTLKEGLTDGASPASWVPEQTESSEATETGIAMTGSGPTLNGTLHKLAHSLNVTIVHTDISRFFLIM